MKIESISIKITNKLNQVTNYEGIQYKQLKLGVYVLLDSLVRIICIIPLAIIFGVVLQTFVVLACSIGLRAFAHGTHLSSQKACTIG